VKANSSRATCLSSTREEWIYPQALLIRLIAPRGGKILPKFPSIARLNNRASVSRVNGSIVEKAMRRALHKFDIPLARNPRGRQKRERSAILKGKQRERISEKISAAWRRRVGVEDKKRNIPQPAIFLARESSGGRGSENKIPLSRERERGREREKRVDVKLMPSINSRCVFINQNRDRAKNPRTGDTCARVFRVAAATHAE